MRLCLDTAWLEGDAGASDAANRVGYAWRASSKVLLEVNVPFVRFVSCACREGLSYTEKYKR